RNAAFDSAEMYYRKSIAIDKEAGKTDAIAWSYYNLGKNFEDRELYDSALYYYKEAETNTSSTFLLRDLYYNLSEVHFLMQDYELSNRYKNKQVTIRDSLDGITREALRLKDNYNRQRQQTEKIAANLKLREAEVLNRNILITTLIVCLLLLAIISFAILKYWQEKQKAELAGKNAEINQQRIDQLLQSIENKEMSAVLRGQETERKRIAQDLHDRLGSMLAVIKIHFNTVQDNLKTIEEENKRQYAKANTLLDEACEEVRHIAHDMSSGVLQKFGLVKALENLKSSINETGHLEVDVLAYGMDDERLDYKREINLYRIIQELVSNTLKHAEASEITIQLIRKDTNLDIMVEDDGTGFDPDRPKRKGMGLINVKDRVKDLNGNIVIDSGKGSGTTVTINIPL
ncbi:MAG: sensor histidine kinase, partial [Cyclobacteriaceae bacterium]